MKKFALITAAIIGGIVLGFYIQPLISEDNIYQQIKKFQDILITADKNYVEQVDTQKLVEAAIRGMLEELDPHSVYISADEMKKVDEDFQGSFEGIGVEFDIINDTITVVSPIQGGPSESLGILSGDKIVKIDSQNAVGISRSDVPKKLKGPKGTLVQVDIVRSGIKDLLHFNITRDKIPLVSVYGSFLIDGTDIGVVQINRFSATTHKEMMEALAELRSKGMKKLVLDLRDNPGGYLNQAYLMADEFIHGGDTIVYTKGRRSEFDEVYIAASGGEYEEIPLIVLISAGSASASEIVSGAIQDLDRGLVVGTTSFGKGLVQRQFKSFDGSAYRLTISKYFTPSGRCIQRPYKDKEEYRHLAGRLELEEGSYIDDPIKKIHNQVMKFNKGKEPEKDKDFIKFDSLPLYKTKYNRMVFGGGGITPDYIIKPDTINKFSRDLRSKNLFFEFANDYVHGEGSFIKNKYQINYLDFVRNFEVNGELINEFKKLAESKDIKWDEDLYKQDQDFVKISIKGNIARIIWNTDRSAQIFAALDNQLAKAIELFPDAMKISRLK
ncbi:MAG: S41 family peptidase [Bacteroidetes bacterium]|nr:MAG: S41 family peptidase [Bacteroidota bacterium]